jgi:arylsulfatase A-like enzyme
MSDSSTEDARRRAEEPERHPLARWFSIRPDMLAALCIGASCGAAIGAALSAYDSLLGHRFLVHGMVRSMFLNLQQNLAVSMLRATAVLVMVWLLSSFLLSAVALVVRLSRALARRLRRSGSATRPPQGHDDDTPLAQRIRDHRTLLAVLIGVLWMVTAAVAVHEYGLLASTAKTVTAAYAGAILCAVVIAWAFVRVRPSWLLAAAAGSLLLLGAVTAGNAIDREVAAPSGPNVVLIMVDTLRADHVGCFGYERATTPTIDRLAATATVFANAHATAPWTSPSVASAITGQHPTPMGISLKPVTLSDRFVTLAEVLREHNYHTHGVISHTYLNSTFGYDQGFDSYDEDNARGHGHISSPSVTDKALAFIEARRDERFFLFLHYFDPHYDYILQPGFDYYPDYDGDLHSGQSIFELRDLAPDLSADDLRFIRALYDSEISFTDAHIGRVLTKLEELGLWHDTLIVFAADHGEEFSERGSHWIGHTRTLYQEQTHVPLIVKGPGGRSQRLVQRHVSLVDLMPSIVEAAGLAVPGSYVHAGRSLAIAGQPVEQTRPVFAETRRQGAFRSAIVDGWKLIRNLEGGTADELYFLADDPGETTNLAAEQPEELERIGAILTTWEDELERAAIPDDAIAPELSEEEIERLKSLGYL